MKLLANAGFSIVEVLVAAALMGGVALGVAKLTQDQAKSTKTIETRFEYNAILNDMRQTLGNNDNCTATFGNRNATNTPEGAVPNIPHIVHVTPTGNIAKYEADINGNGKVYGNGNVRILSYRLDANNAYDNSIGINPVSLTGTVNLTVAFNFGKGQGRTYNAQRVERKIRLNVTVADTANYAITDCSATGSTDGEYVNITGDTMTGDLIMDVGTKIEMRSDKRLKYEIKNLGNQREILRELRPVTFRWQINDEKVFGFIAQDVAQTYPGLVNQNPDGYYSVDYFQFTPLIIKSMQELDSENILLKKEVQKLKKDHSELKNLIEEMRKDMCRNNPSSCK